jgi:hypothetical protein
MMEEKAIKNSGKELWIREEKRREFKRRECTVI